MKKEFKVIEYTFGLFKNIPLEDFLNDIEDHEWGVFQVLETEYWQPGGSEKRLRVVMKRR